jgi:beta-galactosidase
VVVDAPRLALWRAPTDNDGLKLFLGRADGWTDESDKPLAHWLEWGLDDLHRVVDDCSFDVVDGTAVLDASASLHGTDREVVVRHRQCVQVFGSGEIVIDERVELPERFSDVARVGVTFTVAAGFEQLQWLGLGPDETYPDRRRAATVGRWRSTVTDQLAPYLVPQEHGLHLDTRWFALERDDAGRGLLVGALEPFALAFSAGHFTADDLWRARDLSELEPRDEAVVHLDACHRGVGTLSCGPDALPQYRIAPGVVAWRWRLRPYHPATDNVAALARQVTTLTS